MRFKWEQLQYFAIKPVLWVQGSRKSNLKNHRGGSKSLQQATSPSEPETSFMCEALGVRLLCNCWRLCAGDSLDEILSPFPKRVPKACQPHQHSQDWKDQDHSKHVQWCKHKLQYGCPLHTSSLHYHYVWAFKCDHFLAHATVAQSTPKCMQSLLADVTNQCLMSSFISAIQVHL
mmetsp:Transcript_8906/g.54766  ORF Transcript_8906/g.54766 Transcript_8906/m.54766 type:complete len:175 (+) Transcript_8906:903-1427(+)